MTSSQVKKAIDETISNKPLMNEVFVQKVLEGKNKQKGPLPFLQPALVALLMLVIGAVLYFTPQESNQAVDINSQNLSDDYEQLIGKFYAAILQQDEKALAKIAVTDSEGAFFRYSKFNLTGSLQVLRAVEEDNYITVLLKLPRPDGSELIDTLVINKATNKLEIDALQTMKYYVEDVELPNQFTLAYKVAPTAAKIVNLEVDTKEAAVRQIDNHKLYEISTDEGMLRILETPNGEQIDLNMTSDSPIQVIVGTSEQFFFIDQETVETTYIYHNTQGDYQVVTGQFEYPSVVTYATDYHKEPVFLFGGREPKVITIQHGQLVYANIFEQTALMNSPFFYDVEVIGPHLRLKYTEELQQISAYYQFVAQDVLMNDRKIGMLEAKPEHFDDMYLQNRYNDQMIYTFQYGTLHTREKISDEFVENTYTNIQIETKDHQYFITGDNGFSWTLTRTAPRILQDERGIEYTAPIEFEDIQSVNATLLDGEIQTLTVQKAQGFDIQSYMLQGGLIEINELFMKASANAGIVNMVDAEWLVEVEYINGQRQKLLLWLGEEGQSSSMMKTDRFNNEHTLYTIPEELAQQFRQLIKNTE